MKKKWGYVLVLALLSSACGELMDTDARRYNDRDGCWESISVNAPRFERTCTAGSTYAKRGRKYFLFQKGCLPVGFKDADKNEPDLVSKIGAGYCD